MSKTNTSPWDYDRPPKGGTPIIYVECPVCHGEAMLDGLRRDGTIICGECQEWGEAILEECRRNEVDPRTEAEREDDEDYKIATLYDDVADAKMCARFGTQL